MKSTKLYNQIFVISYGFLFTTSFLGFSNEQSIFYDLYQVSKNIVFPISWLCLIFQPNFLSKKYIFINVFFFCAFIYFSYVSKDSSFLIAYLFIVMSKCVDFRRLLRYLYMLSLFSIIAIIIIFLYKYYLIDNAESLFDTVNDRARYTFEMFHPNIFPMRIFIFLTLFFMVRDKVNVFGFFILLVMVFFVYSFSYSRTSFFLSILLILAMYINQIYSLVRVRIFRWIMKISVVIFPFMSIFAMVNYHNYDILYVFNRLLSERIRLSYEAYDLFGLAFIPRDMRVLISENNIVIDNLYVSLSLSNVYSLILFSFINYKFISFLFCEKLYKESLVFFFLILYSMTESHMINIGYNYMMLLISFMLYKESLKSYRRENYYE